MTIPEMGNNADLMMDTSSHSQELSGVSAPASLSMMLWNSSFCPPRSHTTNNDTAIDNPLHHTPHFLQNHFGNSPSWQHQVGSSSDGENSNNNEDDTNDSMTTTDTCSYGFTLLAPPSKRLKIHHNDHQVLIWETIPRRNNSNHHHDNNTQQQQQEYFLIRPDQSLLELFRMEFAKSNEPDWWQILEMTSHTYYHSHSFHLPVSQLLDDARRIGKTCNNEQQQHEENEETSYRFQQQLTEQRPPAPHCLVQISYGKLLVFKIRLSLQPRMLVDERLAKLCPRKVSSLAWMMHGDEEHETVSSREY